MPSTLLSSLQAFLADYEQAQEGLGALLVARGQALEQRDVAELAQQEQAERQMTQTLERLVARRARLLRDAQRQGLAASTLKQLSGAIALGAADARLRAAAQAIHARCDQAEQRAWHLRREGWTQFIIAHRNFSHYTDLVELIANHGHPAPTYADKTTAAGGVVLDAAA